MDDAQLIERMWGSYWVLTRLLGDRSPGGSTWEREGVIAGVVPVARERSVLNCVLYRDAAALIEAVPELAATYDEAGVLAWTVWVHPGDRRVAGALEQAGHVLDATPTAMGMPLDEHRPQPLDAEVRRAANIEELAAVAAPAFHWDGATVSQGYGGLAEGGGHMYLAAVDGVDVCSVAILDHEGDASVWAVGTNEDVRGRGLAKGLLSRALVEARERGCSTTTLQATRAGRPAYERLGYRDLGTLEMWERRRPAEAGAT